jgi:hypothetical protein
MRYEAIILVSNKEQPTQRHDYIGGSQIHQVAESIPSFW